MGGVEAVTIHSHCSSQAFAIQTDESKNPGGFQQSLVASHTKGVAGVSNRLRDPTPRSTSTHPLALAL